MQVTEELFAMQDMGYKAFTEKLVPNVDPQRIIGVRMPDLRRFAKEFAKTPQADAFLCALPHTYHEENLLHGCCIETIRDFDRCAASLDAFLPFVDNWAVCDCMAPKVLGRRPDELLWHVERWLRSGEDYTVRFAIGQLMRWFLDDRFDPAYPERVAAVQSEEYYVNMMRAWYFATALAKQYDAVLPFLTQNRLDVWTHNKTIQKAVESFRVPPEHKAALRALKRRPD